MKSKTRKISKSITIGIDEVGRGPIAGPVAVGAFVILNDSAKKVFKKVKESKQLSEKQREEWFDIIEKMRADGLVDFSVTFQSEKVIDSKGLSLAIRKALDTSLNKVVRNISNYYSNNSSNTSGNNCNNNSGQKWKNPQNKVISINRFEVLLDGGLKAPAQYSNQKTIIKGDEKVMVIALASICAKVLRDRYMIRLAKKYPKYGFEKHKGYGTKDHHNAITVHGVSKSHRLSFL